MDQRTHDLAIAVLSLADEVGMPDSFWQTDPRVVLAREVLEVPSNGRYTHYDRWRMSPAILEKV